MRLSLNSDIKRVSYECVPDDKKCSNCEIRFKCYTMLEFIFGIDLTDFETHTFFKMSGIWK